MERQYCVYKHTAPNGKVYIGITCQCPETRWGKDGKGYISSPHFYSAIQKYGWGNIKHEILETGLSRLEAGTIEKKLIRQYNSTNRRFGYNQMLGGDYGPKATAEVRNKISEALKQYYAEHPEMRELLRANATGYRHSDAARKKMSDSHIGLTHIATEEWRKRISEALKRHYNDPANREMHEDDFERIAEVGRRKSLRVEQIDEAGNVVCVYPSLKEAGRATGIRDGNISKCCRGKTKRAGGYYWRISRVEISSAEKSIN